MWVLCFAKYFLQGRLAALGLQFVYCNPGHSPKIGWKKDFRKPKKMARFWQLRCPVLNCIYVHLGPALDSRLVLQSKENARDTRWVLLSSASFNRNRHSIGVI